MHINLLKNLTKIKQIKIYLDKKNKQEMDRQAQKGAGGEIWLRFSDTWWTRKYAPETEHLQSVFKT